MPRAALLDELRQAAPLVSVGVLTANWMSLEAELGQIEQAGVKLLHVDVMDGCFCPMMTFGPPLIKAIRTPMLKDVHLLIEDPLCKLEGYVAAGADMITVHVESCRHIHRVLQALGTMSNVNDPARGILRGVALNPGTPMETIDPLMDELDMVLLVAVNPGWRGQKFIEDTRPRLSRLKQMVRDSGKDILVGIDGGITRDNAADIARGGPDILVTGSAVFDGKAPLENARHMMRAVRGAAGSS